MRRILIDECINPRLAARLRASLPEDAVTSVQILGLAGLRDRELVARIGESFDVFLTLDKGFEFQHNLKTLLFGIVVLTAANNQMPSYERLLADLVRQIKTVAPGSVVHVVDPGL